MEIKASSFKLRANAPEGRKAISYQLFIGVFGRIADVHADMPRALHMVVRDLTGRQIDRLFQARAYRLATIKSIPRNSYADKASNISVRSNTLSTGESRR